MSHRKRATEPDETRMLAHMASLAHELQSVEQMLLDGDRLATALAGRRLVYVGGRPGSNAVLRELARRAGSEFVHHVARVDADGSARAMRFEALLPGADAVLCPLDTIDRESLAALRVLCARYSVTWMALRTSSVASFVTGVLKAQRLKQHRRASSGCFCLRQG
jgi:hypothetical protein